MFTNDRSVILSALRSGKVIIYPTDTIYGVGCDATNDVAVERVRLLKRRESKPFSVIAPGVEWIRKYCFVPDFAEPFLSKPGAWTLLLRLRSQVVSKSVSVGVLGVRLPNHWFSGLVGEFGRPVVTTSVNVAGELPLRLKRELGSFGADLVVFEGSKRGSASRVVDCTGSFAVTKR